MLPTPLSSTDKSFLPPHITYVLTLKSSFNQRNSILHIGGRIFTKSRNLLCILTFGTNDTLTLIRIPVSMT